MLSKNRPRWRSITIRRNSNWLFETLQSLHPSYFTFVMATGVISIAAHSLHLLWISQCLLWIAVTSYLLLLWLFPLRLWHFRRRFIQDFYNPAETFSYSAFVAATNVIAIRFITVGATGTAWILVAISTVCWFILLYSGFVNLILYHKGAIGKVVSGSWLISVVATESQAVVGLMLPSPTLPLRQAIVFTCYCFWAIGILLYVVFITLIVLRLFFYPLKVADMSPSYWIDMGAVAIATLAGSKLLDAFSSTPVLWPLRPFVEGFTVLTWAWSSWWIPLLVMVSAWKFVRQNFTWRYHPADWSMVFPLGMYTEATWSLASATHFSFLDWIPPLSIWFAVAAWISIFIGLLHRLITRQWIASYSK